MPFGPVANNLFNLGCVDIAAGGTTAWMAIPLDGGWTTDWRRPDTVQPNYGVLPMAITML